MIIDTIVFIAGLLLLTFAPKFILAVAARFILGHAGASAIVSIPIYVGETCQPQLRGITSHLTVTCFACGSAVILMLGAIFPWRIAVGISSALPLVSLVILLICPESPVWLLTQDQEEKAKESLIRF